LQILLYSKTVLLYGHLNIDGYSHEGAIRSRKNAERHAKTDSFCLDGSNASLGERPMAPRCGKALRQENKPLWRL
jgi:hypothetical protein